MPCVVKPLMSALGKGQSVIKTEADIEKAWDYALEGIKRRFDGSNCRSIY